MNIYRCQENPGDTVAVTACAEGVLVVIRSEDAGKAAELEMTAAQAREAADAIDALVADSEARLGFAYGPLYVTEGSEDATIYLSDNPNSGDVRAVLLSREDASAVSACLNASASDSETAALENAFSTHPAMSITPTLTADQLTRAAALAVAAHTFGNRRGGQVIAAAHYILTGDVIL